METESLELHVISLCNIMRNDTNLDYILRGFGMRANLTTAISLGPNYEIIS